MKTVSVSFVVRLDDIATGRPVWPNDNSLRVTSSVGTPIAKNDGYFVFTGARPQFLSITSEVYHDISLHVPETTDILRAALIPRHTKKGRIYELDGGAYIGFCGTRSGYILTDSADTGEIAVHKEDYADLSELCCMISTPDGTETFVYVRAGNGKGRYILSEPVKFPPRSRLLPLYYVPGGQKLRIPVPDGAQYITVLRGETPQKIHLP